MSDKYKLAVFIGRFSPFHNSHMAVVRQALEVADKILILVGSNKSARTIKNPFTADQRIVMIQDSLDKEFTPEEYDIAAIRDYHYSDDLWVSNIQSAVAKVLGDDTDDDVTLITHYKDESSYYLNYFPQWTKTPVSAPPLNATDIRAMYFSENYGENDYNYLIPESVADVMGHFKLTSDYKLLSKEWKYIQEYKRMWDSAPYPVTFVTADAVVIKSGHVLLIRRGREPGKGLLALPGGFIKANERVQDAAIRELKEETRIDVPKPVLTDKIKESKLFDYPGRSLRGRTITTAYLIDLGSGPLPNVRAADDASQAIWTPLCDLGDCESSMFEDHYSIVNYFISRK